MAGPSVTYTFANSTTADATQVNQNFTDIINGLTDGTKDLSISALTAAGSATLNGNVTLGNASSDDITFTGSLASTIAIKTTATYDIGSSTLGLRYVYFGNSTYTTRVAAGTLSASYNLTLPPNGPSLGQGIITDASGGLSWRYAEKTTAKTTTYTATGDETTILCDTSGGAWTLTLPAASGVTGKRYYIKKTTSDTNALTIDGNSSETIDGATTFPLYGQYESVAIVSDGSNWHIVDARFTRYVTATSATENYALTSGHYHGFSGANGSVTLPAGVWEVQGIFYNIRASGTTSLTQALAYWCSAAGADSSTQPTLITATSNVTVDFGDAIAYHFKLNTAQDLDGFEVPVKPLRLTNTASFTLYLVPRFIYGGGSIDTYVKVWATRIG